MGSAVSAVTGAIGGGIGDFAGSMTPKIGTVDQSRVNEQAAALQQQAQAAQGNQAQLQNSANLQANYAQQQAVNAQNLNNGGDVQSALALLQAQANGTAPSAAEGVLQQGTDKAIAQQSALANSGNLSQMLGGQKTAMDNAANLVQQSANQASQLRANQQAVGQQAYAGAAGQQAAQAGTNAANANNLTSIQQSAALGYGGLASNNSNAAGQLGLGGTQLSQGVQTQNAQNQVQATGGLMDAGGAALGLFSDEDLKDNVQSDRATRASAVSGFFKKENEKKPEPKKEESGNSKTTYGDDDLRMKKAKAIKEGFLSSDEEGKENVKNGSMLHAFLDKVEPVTFDYKDADGKMGRTPGKHMGVLAQDVEAAPGGDAMVHETPEGKAIDLASAVGMLMSAAADAHERIGAVEELFKAKKASRK